MRTLLLALASLFLFTSSAQAVEVSNEYELNKPFDLVSSLLAWPSNDKKIVERGGGELVKKDLQAVGVTYSNEGWQFLLRWHRVVNRNGEEMHFKEIVTRKDGEIHAVTTLISEHSEIISYRLETWIKSEGDKTRIRYELKLEHERRGLLVAVVARVKLKQMERAVREIVGDPLPEEEK